MNRPSNATLLWIEALVCFGPLFFMLALGVLFLPVWLAMLAAMLTGVMPWVDGAGTSGWRVVWPVLFVLGGVIGIIGLVRMLVALSGREPPRASRATSVMIFVGLFTLVAHNLYGGLPGNVIALLVEWVLPGIASVHLMYLGRRVYLPRKRVADDELHGADT